MTQDSPSGKVGNQAFTEYDYHLQELKIINALGVNVDIDDIFDELNIYEDLFNNVINGDITISESTDIINKLQIHGNEFLSISFKSPAFKKYEKIFRIYKITDLSLKSTSVASYKLHFCSEEFFINQQYNLSRSFKETKLSEVIKIIARNILRIPESKLPNEAIEESALLTSPEKNPLIIPNMRPLEAINWICSFALSKYDLSPGFFFYENSSGFNLRSFSNLYSSAIQKTIIYSPKNQSTVASAGENHNILDEMEFKQLFDTLDSINNGAFGSRITKVDFLNRTIDTESYSLNSNSFKLLNKYLPFNLAKNRIGNALNESSTFEKMFPKFQGDLVSKWLLVRASRIALLNSTKLHIDIPGDSSLSIGNIIGLQVPQNTAETDSRKIVYDPMLSGLYMIVGLRHKLAGNKYTCHAQLCKDSLGINLNYRPPFNSGWNLAINS